MTDQDSYDLRKEGAEQLFPVWFGRQIASGLQLLQLLQLPRAPRGDQYIESIGLWSADAWWAVRQVGIADLLDEDAVQDAFRVLRTTSSRWPPLSQFLKHLIETTQNRHIALTGGI